MLPARPSDAGPSGPSCTCANRRGDPCRLHDGATCAVCDREGVLPEDSSPCQGSDSCTARICDDCGEAKCEGCGLTACPKHIALDSDSGCMMCDICRRDSAPRIPEPVGLDDNRPEQLS